MPAPEGKTTPEQPPIEAFRDSCFQLLDATATVVRQPIESAKRIVQVAIDSQGEVIRSLGKDATLAPLKDAAEANFRILAFWLRQLTQGATMTQKAWDVLTEATVTWQTVATEAQKASVDAFRTWAANIRS